jgi:TRAP-type C4-dicarboxylate transport system substrate-binding protein
VILATLKAFGANPVPMDWNETFTAMQQGVVDGQENPYIVNYTSKFHEVQKYITEVHYQYSLQPLLIGEKAWQGYDQKTRDILTRAAIEAQQYCIAFQILEAENAKQAMVEAGMQVNTLQDEAEWRKLAVENVWPENYEFVGGKEVIDMVLEGLGKK